MRTINSSVKFKTTCGNVFKISIASLPARNNLKKILEFSFHKLITGFIASGAVGGNGMAHGLMFTDLHNKYQRNFVQTFSINILKNQTKSEFIFSSEK